VAGILPEVFWGLTWNDYDSLLYHHYYRHQQAQWGHRAVALEVYSAVGSFQKGFRRPTAADFWPLPLLDPTPEPVPQIDWARHAALALRSGKRFPTAQA
jgi:hypothetical protein